MKLLLCVVLAVPAAHCFQKDDEQVITRTLQFDGSTESPGVLVDNTRGSIHVTAYDGDAVELQVRRRTRFESQQYLQEANDDVRLEIRDRGHRVELVVDAPWRNRWNDWNNGFEEGYRFYGYEVTFDFELKVPRNAGVYLRTVNEGEIHVEGIQGPFEVRNVNGNVTMTDMGGSGRCTTINGSLEVWFRSNPAEECLFRTVNGKIEVSFQEPLSADLVFKTFNGEAYTDFDVAAVDQPLTTVKKRRGATIYRHGESSIVRAGDGGPRLAFDTLNGSIYVLKHP